MVLHGRQVNQAVFKPDLQENLLTLSLTLWKIVAVVHFRGLVFFAICWFHGGGSRAFGRFSEFAWIYYELSIAIRDKSMKNLKLFSI